MLFNSIHFLLFFPAVAATYYLLPFRIRWIFLLLASYYFYMNWEPVYALLLMFSTAVTFVCSIFIGRAQVRKRKKFLLFISIGSNLAVLGFFKYFNFLAENITKLFEMAGIDFYVPLSSFLLPVGISFYIFQAIGYSIDVYRGTIPPQKHFGKYALFVSFFPQLVAGPIERTANLLPQFEKKHKFVFINFWRGLRLMIFGFFMKLVVADRLALYVDAVYNNDENHSAYSIVLATVFFSFQIYCDFSGYSSIAIGAARVMGFKLMTNFRRPYFSRSISQFWRRWHISLSTWFKDYVYISLGGNRVGAGRMYINLLVTFAISGLWHGANWTFLIWGILNGLYLVLENVKSRLRPARYQHWSIQCLQIFCVFVLINVSWIFFRSSSIEHAVRIFNKIVMAEGKLFVPPDPEIMIYSVMAITIVVAMEFVYEFIYQRRLVRNSIAVQNMLMLFLFFCILLFGVFDGGQFIYFQF